MHRKAFTLIELLVVISIISLLSSVVLASLNSAREKGRIAGGMYFATQVDHLAGEQAVGLWDFNECSGSLAADRSGFNNHATTFVNSPVWVTNTPSGKGCALDFSGATRYLSIPDSSSLDLSTDFTISFWVYLKSMTSSVFMLKGDSTLHGASPSYGFDGNGFMHIAYNASNAPYSPRTGEDLNRWRHFVGVASGTTRTLYMDGKMIGSYNGGAHSWVNSSVLAIGGSTTGYGSNSIIDDVRIYAKTLTAVEVGRLYAEGLSEQRLADNVQ